MRQISPQLAGWIHRNRKKQKKKRPKKRAVRMQDQYVLGRYEWMTEEILKLFKVHGRYRNVGGLARLIKSQTGYEITNAQVRDVGWALAIPIRGTSVSYQEQQRLKERMKRAIKKQRKPQEKVYI